MYYKKLSIEELNRFKYPNLVAEVIESGYSMCTLSEQMGYGRCEENDPIIRGKIFGEIGISAIEGFCLAELFRCKLEYLFSEKLSVCDGKSCAFYRHYEMNRRIEKDIEMFRLAEKLKKRMREDNEFFLFMQVAIDLDIKDIEYKNYKQEKKEPCTGQENHTGRV